MFVMIESVLMSVSKYYALFLYEKGNGIIDKELSLSYTTLNIMYHLIMSQVQSYWSFLLLLLRGTRASVGGSLGSVRGTL